MADKHPILATKATLRAKRESRAEFGLQLLEQMGSDQQISLPIDCFSVSIRPLDSFWNHPYEECRREDLSDETVWRIPANHATRVDMLKPGHIDALEKNINLHWFCASSQAEISNADLHRLQKFESMQGLEIDWSKITQEGLEAVSSFQNLKLLDLSWTRIKDPIQHLVNLEHLEVLRLWAVETNDSDAEHLSQLPNLEEINLSASHLTDEGLLTFESLTHLVLLRLWDTAIGDRGLKGLRNTTRLKRLELDRSQIVGNGLRHLVNMHALQVLSLRQTPLSNAGLAYLETLPSLEKLDIRDSNVSEEGLNRMLKNRNAWELPPIRIQS